MLAKARAFRGSVKDMVVVFGVVYTVGFGAFLFFNLTRQDYS